LANVTISAHAKARMLHRGTDAEEVRRAIDEASWYSAGRGRLDCRLDFPLQGEWNGRRYRHKQVRPVFIEDSDGVLVLTVYTYFS
jgi:hypothetical protein